MFDKKLKKRFANTYKFASHDVNKFILLLQKGVCEYMGSWEKFNETSLPEEKQDFYSHSSINSLQRFLNRNLT